MDLRCPAFGTHSVPYLICYAYQMKDHTGDDALVLLRAVLALGRRLRAARPPNGLTVSGLSILGTLSRLGPIPATRLAAEERLQPQSLTRLIAALEEQGLIERSRGAVDRRELTIALTHAGRTALAADLRERQRWLAQALDTLAPGERRALISATAAMQKLAFHGDDPADA